jgi:hypothetical protein
MPLKIEAVLKSRAGRIIFYLNHGMGTARLLFVRLAVGNKWTKTGIVLTGHLLGSRRA